MVRGDDAVVTEETAEHAQHWGEATTTQPWRGRRSTRSIGRRTTTTWWRRRRRSTRSLGHRPMTTRQEEKAEHVQRRAWDYDDATPAEMVAHMPH